ncbi:MAG: hypothetical protein QM723_08075 [Myxococcaceae bacterium]
MVAAMCLAMALSAEPQFIHAFSSPHQARILQVEALTPEQIGDAPVGLLNLSQLRLEDRRLADPPSMVTPIVLASVGGVALVGGSLATYFLINSISGAGLGGIILAIFAIYTGAIAVVGAAGLIVGLVMLPGRIDTRARYAERQKEVHERIALIQSGQVQEPYSPNTTAENLQTELYALDQEKPGFALPITLGAVGLGVGAYSGFFWSSSSPSSSSGNTAVLIGITGIVSGLIMVGIATWVLIDRVNTRNNIDARIDELRSGGTPQGPVAPPPPPGEVPPGGDVVPPPPPPPPPSASQLPPAPIFAAYSWRF